MIDSDGNVTMAGQRLALVVTALPAPAPVQMHRDDDMGPERTQAFLLVGTLVLLPVILMYTGWSYWVFRGKVRADIGYH